MSETAEAVIDGKPAEVVDAAPKVTAEAALAVIRTTTLAELSLIDQGIAKLKEAHGATDYDIKTPKGLALAKERRHAIRQVRFKVPHIVKARKEELAKVTASLASEAERITLALKAIEDPHDTIIAAREKEIEAEKAERDRIEAERKAKHAAAVATIRSYADQAIGKTAERLTRGIEALQAMAFGPEWEEFKSAAEDARAETLGKLSLMQDAAERAEKQAAQLEAQRLENERIAAENAERQRQLDEQAAALKRQAEEFKEAQQRAIQPATMEPVAKPDAGMGNGETPAPGEREAPQKPTADEGNVVVPGTPGLCPSSEAEAAQALPSGCEGRGVRAGRSTARPMFDAPIETTEDEAVPLTEEMLAAISQADAAPAFDGTALLREALEFTKYAAAPFFGKFPSQPKTTREWWDGLREQIEALQPKLIAAIGGKS